jgi:5'-nucleotidase (lipoprotein e(P4) family)
MLRAPTILTALLLVGACARFQSAPGHSPENIPQQVAESSAPAVNAAAEQATAVAPAAPDTTMKPGLAPLDNLNAVLWFQTAAEYQASALQAFAAARTHLPALVALGATAIPDEQKRDLTGEFSELPPAVVVDVDETMLDNAIYMARLVRDGQKYDPQTWAAFCREDISTAIPGAAEFTQFAKANNVRVIYISNRDAELVEVTRQTLKRLGFADADSDANFAFRDKAKGWDSKGARRSYFAKTHRVVMVIGDNLGDFTEAYRGTPAERATLVRAVNRWGNSWIMLPNPMYGSWEAPFEASDAQSAREKRLQGLILAPRS